MGCHGIVRLESGWAVSSQMKMRRSTLDEKVRVGRGE